jgi:hypothetical protein
MGIQDKLASLKASLGELKSQGIFPKKMGRLDKFLVSFVVGLMGAGFMFIGASLTWLVSELKHTQSQSHTASHSLESASENDHGETHRSPASEIEDHTQAEGHESEGHEESADAHGGEKSSDGHGGSAPVELGADILPKSIKKRQDGEMAEGYDLTDPEIKQEKGLAGLLEQDLKVSVGYRTVDIHEIVSGSKMGDVGDASVYLDVTFEVDTFEGQNEVEDRKTEIKSLVSALISSFPSEVLRTDEGKAALKVEVYKEVNRLLLRGQITDVLFTNIMIR